MKVVKGINGVIKNYEKELKVKNKGIWVIVSVLVVLGLILASCAQAPAPTAPTAPTTPAVPVAPKVIKWQGQVFSFPVEPSARFPLYSTSDSDVVLAKYLEKVTGGRLVIDIAPPASIVAQTDLLGAVSRGTLDITTTFPGLMTGQIPEIYVLMGLPFAWQEPADVFDAFYQWGLQKESDVIMAEQNVWSANYGMGPLNTIATVGMATSPAFIKGKKIRAGGIWQKYIEALGGTPTIVTYAEMYMALKTGMIDGTLMYSSTALMNTNQYEVLDSIVMYPNTSSSSNPVMFNLDSLKALPDDMREVVMESTATFMAWYGLTRWYYYDRWIPYELERQGHIKVIRWSEEDAQYAKGLGYGLWAGVAARSPRVARLAQIVKQQAISNGKMTAAEAAKLGF